MVDARGQRLDVVGLDGREHRDPQLVAAELAVGLGVDDPVGAQHLRDRRGVDRVVEVDRADDLRAHRRVGHERRRVVALLGPGVEPARGVGGALGRPRQAALRVEPVDLLGQQEQRRERRGVVGLVEPGVVDRDLQVAEGRHPPAGRLHVGDPLRARPATSARATARRRRRRTSAARSSRRRSRATSTGSPPAPDVASTSTSAPSSAPVDAAQRHRDAGRGLVVREGVGVDAGLGARLRVGARARSRRRPGRRGTAPPSVAAANFEENSPKTRCCERSRDQAEHRDVPEGGRAAVAEHDLVAVGQREQRRPSPDRTRPTTSLTVRWRCEVPRYVAPVAASAATASGRTFDGPEPKRPSAGLRSVGDGDVGRRGSLTRPTLGQRRRLATRPTMD